MKNKLAFHIWWIASLFPAIFLYGCNNGHHSQGDRPVGGDSIPNFLTSAPSPIFSDGEREHPIPEDRREYHASRGVSTLEEAYLEGYDDGYEDGEEDGAKGEDYGLSFDPDSDFTGQFAQSYDSGYEDGYHDGYHTNYKIFKHDEDEDEDEE